MVKRGTPFVSVFEPTTEREGRSVQSIEPFTPAGVSGDFVGLTVRSKSGRTDYLFSSVNDERVEYRNMSVRGTYAIVSEQGTDFVLFLGNGKFVNAKGFTIEASEKTNVVLECKNGKYFITCEKPVTVKSPKNKKGVKIDVTDYKQVDL
ncbi:MAG: hypothetical protein LBV74_03195 [Tannerella sp.]|jgi:hypothetical protein|nr:hypothetical protein [Tannerella sp.]